MPEPTTPLAERPWEDVDRLLSVDEAREHVLQHVQPLPPMTVPLPEARGLVCVGAVVARTDVPPFTNSAMDGYAVRFADTMGASTARPVRLRVVGAVAAGELPSCAVEPGSAVRIMTGAVLPIGADAVVRFEETAEVVGEEEPSGRVAILRAAKHHDNVRLAGEDIAVGAIAIAAGTVLHAAHLGLLASLGDSTVAVYRRPRVGVLSTGNEVVAATKQLVAGQIHDSNSVTLAALVEDAGGIPVRLGVVRDEMAPMRRSLQSAVNEHGVDLLITSGGVSVGDYDMVKDALQAEGDVALWQVRIKPGKPMAFGMLSNVPLLGLPGNPVAAAVSFLQFGRPAIRRMLGYAGILLPRVIATLVVDIDNRGSRRHYVRVRLKADGTGGFRAVPVGEQGAGILSSLALADGLLVLPEEITVARAGMRLPVELLHDRLPSAGL